jgi:hypothetical protein
VRDAEFPALRGNHARVDPRASRFAASGSVEAAVRGAESGLLHRRRTGQEIVTAAPVFRRPGGEAAVGVGGDTGTAPGSCLRQSWVTPGVADQGGVRLSFRFVVDLVPPVDSFKVVVVDVVEELPDVGEFGCAQRVAVLLLDPEEAWDRGAAEEAAGAFAVG